MPRIKLKEQQGMYMEPTDDMIEYEAPSSYPNNSFPQMKNIMRGHMKPLSLPVRTSLHENNQMGGFFDIIADPESYLKEITADIEQSVKSEAQQILPPELYEKASAAVKRTGEKLEEQATDVLSQELSKYAQDKNVQDKAITSGVSKIAENVSNTLISVKDLYGQGGIAAVYRVYPVPFWITGGVATLLTLRFVMGRRPKIVYAAPKAKANPGKKRRRKRRK